MKHNVLYSRCFPFLAEYYTTRVKEKTSAQHQQPHKNQEYPHKRKLPFLPNSAAADTVNTYDLEDNTDATVSLPAELAKAMISNWNKQKEDPKAQDSLSKAAPASLDTTWKTQLGKT